MRVFSQLLRQTNIFRFQNNQNTFRSVNEQLKKFTGVHDKKLMDEKNKKVSTGRSWYADELRLKSTEDLHKLWYVLLIEKNKLISDNSLKKKLLNTMGPQGKLSQVKVTMARLLTVVAEREKIQRQYRESLEQEYLKQQKEAYDKLVKEQEVQTSLQVKVPQITHELLREKYRDLKKGIDNTTYIQRSVEKEEKWKELKKQLQEKYDYKNKKIVPADAQVEDETKVIRQFTSFFQKQLAENREKVSQEEVLRAHVKNWHMLTIKQRRIVINQIQARRARDAKNEFQKELSLLSQKVQYDKTKNAQTTQN